MRLEHHFTVAVPVEDVWRALLDPQRMAACLPGATVVRADGGEFAGSLTVRLGSLALTFSGCGVYREVDRDEHRVVIDTCGQDEGANGRAAATTTIFLDGEGEMTVVSVETDLRITGIVPEFGRGSAAERAGQVLHEFETRLVQRLAGAGGGHDTSALPVQDADTAQAQRSEMINPELRRAMSAHPSQRPVAAGASRGAWRVTAPLVAEEDLPAAVSIPRPARQLITEDEVSPAAVVAEGSLLERVIPMAFGAGLVLFALLVRRVARRLRRRR